MTPSPRRRSRIAVATLAFAACTFAGAALAASGSGGDNGAIRITSWGGVYQKSQREAYFKPFTKKTGIPIKEDKYDGNFDAVIKQVKSGNVHWDLVDVTLADAIRGCNNGDLEPIPPSILPPAPDGTPAMQDFLPNTLQECAVGEILWSTLWAYNKKAFGKNPPKTVEDVFNVDKFPGKRGMRKTPRNNLEFALMADGVAPKDVYSTLSTDAGVKRAFAKLDSIRDHIKWWQDGSKPQKWLADGTVTLSTAYNGRIFNSIVKKDEPLAYVWDGQLWQIDLWAIPRGAKHLANVLKFVSFSTGTKPLAAQTEYVSYAPARKSSLPLVRPAYQKYMPTAPGNFRNAVQSNFLWWADHQKSMNERFDAWLSQGSSG